MSENALFVWHRDPPPEWVDALTRFAPRTDNSSHLALWWESGTPAEPAQRWVIYEATPVRWVQPWRLQAFLADHPCTCAYESALHATCRRCGGIQSPGRARIFAYLHRTECLALPYWVIQGSNGGHRRRYTQIEQQWAALAQLPEHPPETGALPYAPLDQRVFRQIRRFDRAMRAYVGLQTAFANEKRDAEIAYRTALSDYIDHGVAEAFDAVPVTRKSSLRDEIPQDFTQTTRRVDYDAERDAFIHRKD